MIKYFLDFSMQGDHRLGFDWSSTVLPGIPEDDCRLAFIHRMESKWCDRPQKLIKYLHCVRTLEPLPTEHKSTEKHHESVRSDDNSRHLRESRDAREVLDDADEYDESEKRGPVTKPFGISTPPYFAALNPTKRIIHCPPWREYPPWTPNDHGDKSDTFEPHRPC